MSRVCTDVTNVHVLIKKIKGSFNGCYGGEKCITKKDMTVNGATLMYPSTVQNAVVGLYHSRGVS